MYEKFLALTKQEVAGFLPVERFEELLDLTPRNLWDLCDIAVRFGDLDCDAFGKPGVFFAHRHLRIEVYNFIGNGAGGAAGMMIGKHRPGSKFQSTEEGSYFPSLLNGMHVIWDRGHTVREVQFLLYEIDKISYAHGHVVGGRRSVLN